MTPPITKERPDLEEGNIMQIMTNIAKDVGEIKGVQEGQAIDISDIKVDVKELKDNYIKGERRKGRNDVLVSIMVPIISVLGGGVIILVAKLLTGG